MLTLQNAKFEMSEYSNMTIAIYYRSYTLLVLLHLELIDNDKCIFDVIW